MSETQNYKTVSFKPSEFYAVQFALVDRVRKLEGMLRAHDLSAADRNSYEALLMSANAALRKVDA